MTEQEELSKRYSDIKEKYVRLKEASGECLQIKYRYGKLLEKAAEMDEYIRELEEKNKQLAATIEKLSSVDGGIVLQVDGKEMGRYVHQNGYIRVVEKNKQLQEEIKQLKQDHASKTETRQDK